MNMTEHTASRLRRLASPRRATAVSPGGRAAALLLRLGCAALLAWIGIIHLHLWLEGYRHIPTNGPLFLLDAVAGFILAAVMLAWPRPLAGLLAAGYAASTLGALIISLSAGLFGFRESISASHVTESLTIDREHEPRTSPPSQAAPNGRDRAGERAGNRRSALECRHARAGRVGTIRRLAFSRRLRPVPQR
jgi:hypothetical protein